MELDEKEFNIYNIVSVEKGKRISTALKNITPSSKYLLSQFTNLKDAYNEFFKNKIDILISDISYAKEMDLSILKKIRKENKDLYIFLIIDSQDSSITIKDLNEISAQGYCSKDDKLNQLSIFIETAIKSLDQMNMIKTMNEELLASKEQLVKSYLESIEILRYIVEAKDTYTRGHSERVSEYSVLIGKNLGLSKLDLRTLKIGGLFHDIGKIGI